MKVSIVMEYSLANISDTIEVEIKDGLSEKEIDEEVREEVFNYFSWGYEIKKDMPEPKEA